MIPWNLIGNAAMAGIGGILGLGGGGIDDRDYLSSMGMLDQFLASTKGRQGQFLAPTMDAINYLMRDAAGGKEKAGALMAATSPFQQAKSAQTAMQNEIAARTGRQLPSSIQSAIFSDQYQNIARDQARAVAEIEERFGARRQAAVGQAGQMAAGLYGQGQNLMLSGIGQRGQMSLSRMGLALKEKEMGSSMGGALMGAGLGGLSGGLDKLFGGKSSGGGASAGGGFGGFSGLLGALMGGLGGTGAGIGAGIGGGMDIFSEILKYIQNNNVARPM